MAERTGRHDDPREVDYDAVVLAGGQARRFGGVDKAMLRVDGVTLLDRVLGACAMARTITVVGPRRAVVESRVRWTREHPPGGGPVAALGAALDASGPEYAPYTLVLAADLAFLGAATVLRLVTAARREPCDGAVLVDANGRDQPLTAVYRTAPLAAALDACRDDQGRLDGTPMRAVLARLTMTRLTDASRDSFDCDTWDALYAARDLAREDGSRGR